MNKPEVQYDMSDFCKIILGQGAIVTPLNHPSPHVSNTGSVHTSRVISITDEDFETENTRYVGVRK